MVNFETQRDAASQAQQDSEHLGLLSLFHYILGTITVLFSSIFIFHVVMGIAMIHNPAAFDSPTHPSDPFPLPMMGWMFTIMGLIVVLGGWTLGLLTISAGRCLSRRKNLLFIQVIAGLNCGLTMPLGTVLGVFTFIVTMRPTVKALFERYR